MSRGLHERVKRTRVALERNRPGITNRQALNFRVWELMVAGKLGAANDLQRQINGRTLFSDSRG